MRSSIGDGRDVADEDKINEQNIRPIATDHELYTTVVNVNIDDANSDDSEVVDAIVMNRQHYKGSGLPTMYTTETVHRQVPAAQGHAWSSNLQDSGRGCY